MRRAVQRIGSRHVRYEHGDPLVCDDCGTTSDLHLWFDVVADRGAEVRYMHGLICRRCVDRGGVAQAAS